MEFLVLPLLLLAGLVTSLDGGSDEDGGNGSGDENDVLTGSGTEHVYGQTGDDDLTLSDHAVGMGGDGNDTLNAVDEAVGYGLAGDDSLIGADNAAIKGGEGDDWLSASDEAAAYGGAGNDAIFASGDAAGHGGDGDDTLTASGEAVIWGGAGNDVLVYQDSGRISAPEEGDDIYVLDHASGGASLGFEYQARDAGDRIAIHLGTDDLSRFTFQSTSGSQDGSDGPRGDITEINITETLEDGSTVSSYLSIRGVYGYGLRNLILYGEEIGEEVDWQAYFGENDFIQASGTEIVYGGAGNDIIETRETAVGHGDEGDDTIRAYGTSTAYGGAGDDRLTEFGGPTSLYGGLGADDISVTRGTGFGGAGDDVMRADFSGTVNGGAGNDDLTVRSTSTGNGGEGDDTILGFGNAVVNGGAGDDLIQMRAEFGGTVTASGGAGADRFVMDDLVDTMEEAAILTGSTLVIRDFDPAVDVLGVVFDPEKLDSLQIGSRYDADADATTVTITQHYPGEEPPLQTVASFVLEGVQTFAPTTLQFYADDSLVPTEFSMEGTAGADVLAGGHPSGMQTGMGYGGDDTITAGLGGARGGDGDDVVRDGAGWISRGDLYGEAGNDSLSGSGDLYGGDGNDVISLGARQVSFNAALWPDYILDGAAYGGAGDDTISAGAPAGDPDHGSTSDIPSGVQIDAGAGNDLIRYSDGMTVDAGSGDDTVIRGTHLGGVSAADPTVTLGDGADRFFLAPEQDAAWTSARIVDFDPAEDALGIIAPEAEMTGVQVAVSYDAAADRTTISFDTRGVGVFDGYLATYVLDGVNGEANPIAISLFANEAAALAGTPYRTL